MRGSCTQARSLSKQTSCFCDVNMSERKIQLVALTVVIYCLYSASIWFTTPAIARNDSENATGTPDKDLKEDLVESKNYTVQPPTKPKLKPRKRIPLYFKNACSVLEVFMSKPPVKWINKSREMDSDDNQIAVIGITVLLIALAINAVLDVLKVKEEERIRQKNNPGGERRQSLAEFANKKTLRRESSKFSLQLFQIAESIMNPEENKEEKPTRSRPTKIYRRGDSTNSYLSERNCLVNEGATPKSAETPTGEARSAKRQSAAKIFGARPAPMVRRSSFPALPLNPDIQALMLGNRRPSTDSDDEDGKGRRVRIIRRY